MGGEPQDMHQHFEDWYAAMPGSPRKDEIVQRHLGLPPELLSTSLLPWDGLADVTDALQLEPGQLLLDLACGRGGYGLEIAARTGARLIGVDFAEEAIRQAKELAARRGIGAEFRVGDLTDTGLPDACADAALVVDAIQFPPDPAAAYAELARVLRPGGRVVLTCWEALDPSDETLHEALRRVDLGAGLAGAGFVDVEVRDKPAWMDAEQTLWTEAATLEVRDDKALADLKEEAEASLPEYDLTRRVMANAVRPS